MSLACCASYRKVSRRHAENDPETYLVKLSPDQVEEAYLKAAKFPLRVNTYVLRSGLHFARV